MKGKLSLSVGRRPTGQAILRVDGTVDPSTFSQFEEAFRAFDDQGIRHLVIDLSLLSYISSSGLSLLIKAKTDRSTPGSDVVLLRPQPAIVDILQLMGLTDFFRLASTLEEALLPRDPA